MAREVLADRRAARLARVGGRRRDPPARRARRAPVARRRRARARRRRLIGAGVHRRARRLARARGASFWSAKLAAWRWVPRLTKCGNTNVGARRARVGARARTHTPPRRALASSPTRFRTTRATGERHRRNTRRRRRPLLPTGRPELATDLGRRAARRLEGERCRAISAPRPRRLPRGVRQGTRSSGIGAADRAPGELIARQDVMFARRRRTRRTRRSARSSRSARCGCSSSSRWARWHGRRGAAALPRARTSESRRAQDARARAAARVVAASRSSSTLGLLRRRVRDDGVAVVHEAVPLACLDARRSACCRVLRAAAAPPARRELASLFLADSVCARVGGDGAERRAQGAALAAAHPHPPGEPLAGAPPASFCP